MEKIITIINRVGTKKHQLNGVEYTSTAIGIELIGRCRHLPPPILIFLHCNTPISSISQIHSESLYKNNSSTYLFIGWKWLIHPITPIINTIHNTTSHIRFPLWCIPYHPPHWWTSIASLGIYPCVNPCWIVSLPIWLSTKKLFH